MKDKVIVTIRLEDGSFEDDFEIPVTSRMQDVIPQLENHLAQIAPKFFQTETAITLYANGAELKGKDSLSSRDLWDGSIITVRRTPKWQQ